MVSMSVDFPAASTRLLVPETCLQSKLLLLFLLLMIITSFGNGRQISSPLNEEIEEARGLALRDLHVTRNMTVKAKCESIMVL